MDRRLRAFLFGIEVTLVAVVLAMSASSGGIALGVAFVGLVITVYGVIEPSRQPA